MLVERLNDCYDSCHTNELEKYNHSSITFQSRQGSKKPILNNKVFTIFFVSFMFEIVFTLYSTQSWLYLLYTIVLKTLSMAFLNSAVCYTSFTLLILDLLLLKIWLRACVHLENISYVSFISF